ncbi:hypothetical protein J6590_073696 [Homalodisca vitripennis]|nr:hypothetical protein J6590_073696 [Homalodisca vitripennis]
MTVVKALYKLHDSGHLGGKPDGHAHPGEKPDGQFHVHETYHNVRSQHEHDLYPRCNRLLPLESPVAVSSSLLSGLCDQMHVFTLDDLSSGHFKLSFDVVFSVCVSVTYLKVMEGNDA